MKQATSSHGLHGASLCTPYLLLVPLGLLAVLLVLPSLGSSNACSDGLGVLCGGAGTDGYSVSSGAVDSQASAGAAPPTRGAEEFSLLVGVLTMPSRRERRDVVRMASALQPPALPGVARVAWTSASCSAT